MPVWARVRVECGDDLRIKVIDLKTGKEIPNIRKVVWTYEVGHAPTVQIDMACVQSSVVGFRNNEYELRDITSHSSPGFFQEWIKVKFSWWKRLFCRTISDAR